MELILTIYTGVLLIVQVGLLIIIVIQLKRYFKGGE